jgi:hypothetical protein
MITALYIFGSTFVVVFALGIQSLNVNGGYRWLAAVTSLVIGGSNLVLFKLLPQETNAIQIAAYLLGGPAGIVASMAAHPMLLRWSRRPNAPTPAARRTHRVVARSAWMDDA